MCTNVADYETKNGSKPIPRVDTKTWDLRTAIRDFERRYISAVLASAGGDKVKAARRLGIGLSSLYRKLDEVEMEEMEMMNNGPPDTPMDCEEQT